MSEGLSSFRSLAAAVGIAVAVFMALPLAIVAISSLTDGLFLTFPPKGLSARWYEALYFDPVWRKSFFTSLYLATSSSIIATVLGTAGALGLRRAPALASVARPIFLAPLVLPYVVYGLGLYLVVDSLRLIGNPAFVIVSQACIAFPIALLIVSAGLSTVPPSLSRAAESLGANWAVVAWRVEFPLIRSSIASAALLTFVYCFDELIIPLFIGGVELVPFSLQIYRATRESVSPSVAAASVVLMLLALLLSAAGALISRRARPATR